MSGGPAGSGWEAGAKKQRLARIKAGLGQATSLFQIQKAAEGAFEMARKAFQRRG